MYKLLIYTSPIYVAVLINFITGLPFYATLVTSVFIVYLIGDKNDFAKITYKSLNWNTVLTVTAILIMKEMILNLEDLISLFTNMLNGSGGLLSIVLIFFISTFFFGYITGNHTAALAIMLPMVSKLNIDGGLIYVYTFLVSGSGFLGYYLSPLHLCQVFTLEHMKVSTGQLYKEYRFYIPLLVLVLIILVFVFQFIV